MFGGRRSMDVSGLVSVAEDDARERLTSGPAALGITLMGLLIPIG